jgi:hypothetical protein
MLFAGKLEPASCAILTAPVAKTTDCSQQNFISLQH